MKSQKIKRSVEIDGRSTSVSLEDEFWNALKEIAAAQRTTAQGLVLKIHNERTHPNLSSVIRLHILSYYRERCDAKPRQPHGPPMTLGNMRGERGLKLTRGSIDGHL